MINLNMIRYYNEKTMKMTELQLRELKLKTDFKNEQLKYKKGVNNYEIILNQEIQQICV